MNIVKKLKLALLATSVMLFPKAGYAMDPKDEEAQSGLSTHFNSLMPFGPSNKLPASSSQVHLRGSQQMEHLFGQNFIPNQVINQRLDDLQNSMSSAEYNERIEAIRTHIVDRLANRARYQPSRTIHPDLLKNAISVALTLSKDDIEQRSNAITRAIVDLDHASPRHYGGGLMPVFKDPEYGPKTKEEHWADMNERFSNIIYIRPEIRSSFTELLEFNPNQIINRTEVIKENARFLLPIIDSSPQTYSTIESLLKLRAQDIADHATSMKKLLAVPPSRYLDPLYESVKKAAALLDSSSLKERADEFLNLLKSSPELEPIADKLSYLAVKLEPEDFRRYVASQNPKALLINLHHSYSPLEPLMFVELIKSESTVSDPSSSSGPELEETVSSPSSSSSIHSAPITYRTTGENTDAINKHSAVSIQLSNEDLQTDAAYELIINHRTRDKGAQVRVFDQKTKKLNILGILPYSLGFSDESFDITPWVKSMREGGPSVTNIAAFLTFAFGQSDIHSFKIQSGGNIIREMVFGDKDSEDLPGIHVYGPETDGNSNEWSKSRTADEQ